MKGTCSRGTECSFAHSWNELRERPNFRKSKLCYAFKAGRCTNCHCNFAHGETELQAPEATHKNALCKLYASGHCQDGDRCRYAHSTTEVQTKYVYPTFATPPSTVPPAKPSQSPTQPSRNRPAHPSVVRIRMAMSSYPSQKAGNAESSCKSTASPRYRRPSQIKHSSDAFQYYAPTGSQQSELKTKKKQEQHSKQVPASLSSQSTATLRSSQDSTDCEDLDLSRGATIINHSVTTSTQHAPPPVVVKESGVHKEQTPLDEQCSQSVTKPPPGIQVPPSPYKPLSERCPVLPSFPESLTLKPLIATSKMFTPTTKPFTSKSKPFSPRNHAASILSSSHSSRTTTADSQEFDDKDILKHHSSKHQIPDEDVASGKYSGLRESAAAFEPRNPFYRGNDSGATWQGELYCGAHRYSSFSSSSNNVYTVGISNLNAAPVSSTVSAENTSLSEPFRLHGATSRLHSVRPMSPVPMNRTVIDTRCMTFEENWSMQQNREASRITQCNSMFYKNADPPVVSSLSSSTLSTQQGSVDGLSPSGHLPSFMDIISSMRITPESFAKMSNVKYAD